MPKRTLDSFFTPASKRAKPEPEAAQILDPPQHIDDHEQQPVPDCSPPTGYSYHATYPWPVRNLPADLATELSLLVTTQGTSITNQPHLDLLHFQPFIPRPLATTLFNFLRSNLFFYRVRYTIYRFGKETIINTPRYTTVFGLDETSLFSPDSNNTIIDAVSKQPINPKKYKTAPRPIPQPLALLQRITSAATNTSYNFCLVNYYASGADSISFHSDDERFLGPEPAIASFSLGGKRDFLMKHKPPAPANGANNSSSSTNDSKTYPGTSPLKFPLSSGDMILMRGETQANWLHSIPKRSGKDAERDGGRINITFRKAMVPGGTENYYRYNVGEGGVWRWDESRKEMVGWKGK